MIGGLVKKGRLWWGDKGVSRRGERIVGTSGNKMRVGPIRMDCMYGGDVKTSN